MFKRFRIIPFIFIIFFVVLSCTSRKDRIDNYNNSKKIWLSETNTDLNQDPSIIGGKLTNGFRYFILRNKKPKNRVSMHLVIEAGSIHEKESQRGLAHYLEHMVFNGSEHFKPGELVKYFQKLGMDFGGDANAHTGFFHTVYDIVLPKGDKKSLEEGFLVLHDYANSALLLESEIEKERGIILSEKRDRNSASYRTFEKVLNFELGKSLVTKRLPIGTEEIIKKAKRSDLKDFYDTWYRPEKMVLILTGDLKVKEVEKLIRKKFSSLKARAKKREEPDLGTVNHKGIKTFYHHEEDSASTSVKIEIIYNGDYIPDSKRKQRDILINYIGDSIVQNRIKSITGKKDTDFVSSFISSGSFLKKYRYATISAKCKSEKWDEALVSIEQILRSAIEYGFSEKEFIRVKKEIEAYYINKVKSSSTRNSLKLSREIISSLKDGYVFQSPEQELKLFRSIIKSIDVKEITEVFKEKWSRDHKLIVVTGNAKIKGDARKKILEIYKKSKKIKAVKHEDLLDVTFPYLDDPVNKGKIEKKSFDKDLGILKIQFANGNILNLKKTDYNENEILFRVNFGHGKVNEPEEMPGISDFAVSVVNQSGFKELDRDQIDRALTGKNTFITLNSGRTEFNLSGKSVSSELNLMFRLIYTYFNDMGFRDDALIYVKNKYRQRYNQMRKTVEGLSALKADRFFAGGDSRFGLTDYKKISKYKLSDVKSFMEAKLKETPVEVSLVGDFDIDHAVLLASRFIGTLPAVEKKQPQKSKSIKFPNGKYKEIKVNSSIRKGQVIIAFPTEDFWNIRRTRRLSVLGTVISNRLHDIIREKKAIAYSPYAYNYSSTAYKNYGYLKAVIGIDPKNKKVVVDEIRKITDDLRKNGIKKDELRRALDPILTNIKDYRKKNSYWLRSVLSGSSIHPEKFDWSRSFFNDYKSITHTDINKLASKYLKEKNKAVFVVVSE